MAAENAGCGCGIFQKTGFLRHVDFTNFIGIIKMDRLKSYKRMQQAAFALLLFYFCGGLATLAVPGREVFPIYSWFLFALVPQNEARFEILIVETKDGVLEEPLPWNRAHGEVFQPDSISVYHLIQALGRAVSERDEMEEARLRGAIEMYVLRKPMRYRLVSSLYHPIKRWRSGKIDLQEVLEEFVTEEPQP